MRAHEPDDADRPAAPGHPPGRARAIADRIDHLISRDAARAGGRAPTYRELADRINTLAGRDVISKDTIRNLHHGVTQKGQSPNPTVDTLDWLGRGFGIRQGAAYFLDDRRTADVDEQLDRLDRLGDLRQALGNSGVVSLVKRASGLSDNSLNMLLVLAERLRTLEEGASAPSSTPGAGAGVAVATSDRAGAHTEAAWLRAVLHHHTTGMPPEPDHPGGTTPQEEVTRLLKVATAYRRLPA